MAIDANAKKLLSLAAKYEAANKYYHRTRPYFEYLAAFLAPSQVGYYTESTDVERLSNMQRLASKEGVVLARQIADGLREDVLPTGRPFFDITADDKFRADLRQSAEQVVIDAGITPDQEEFEGAVEAQFEEWEHLHRDYRQALRSSIHQRLVENGGLSVRLGEIIHDLVVFGNAGWTVKLMKKQNKIVVESIPLSSIRVENKQSIIGEPMRVFRKINASPEEMQRTYPLAKNIQLGDNPSQPKEYILSQQKILTDFNTDKPDYYLYSLTDDKFASLEGEWEENTPLIALAKGNDVTGEAYGEGIGAHILGDAEILNSAKRDFLKAMKLLADPPYLIDDGLMKQGKIPIRPGERIPMSQATGEGDPVRPVQVAGNPEAAMSVSRELQQDIRNNAAYTPGTTQAEKGITAYQWESHLEVDAKKKSQILHIIEFYILRGIVGVAYEKMRQEGLLDAATRVVMNRKAQPLYAGELRLKFTGPDAAIMRRLRVNRLGGFIQYAAQYEASPQIHIAIPREKFYTKLAQYFEIDPEIVNSPGEMRKIQQAIQEAQQQIQQEQAQAEQAAQQGGQQQ